MTLLTDDFVFIHVPKTGGSFVSKLFIGTGPSAAASRHRTPAYLPERWQATCPGEHKRCAEIPATHLHLPHIAVRRNPWAWYVSWHQFHLKHLSMAPSQRQLVENGPWGIASEVGRLSFNETVRNVQRGDEGIYSRTHRRLLALNEKWESILDTDITYLRQLYLREDLCAFLRRFDEIPTAMEKAIMKGPRVNVSTKKDYRTYYDDETAQLVENAEKTFIEKFGYTFEK